jgi:hypothetical protein
VLLSFQSYSSGKKTLETFKLQENVQIYWVNVNRLIVARANTQSHFYSFYYGDAIWPWVTLLPDEQGPGVKNWPKS